MLRALKDKKEFKITHILMFITLLIIIFYTWYFYPFVNFESRNCDMYPHYQFALNIPKVFTLGLSRFRNEISHSHILSYPLWHCMFLLIHSLIKNNEMALGLTNAIFMAATFLCLYFLFKLNISCRKKEAISIVFSLCILVVGPLYSSYINENYYLGQFASNVWHNPTTIAIKPFAILSFTIYLEIIKQINSTLNSPQIKKKFILFSIILATSTLAKPNFFQIFAPALAAFCIIYWFKDHRNGLIFGLQTIFAMLPSCVMVLLQYYISFGSDSEFAVGIFKVWRLYTNNLVGSFLLSTAFPMAVIIIYGKHIKNSSLLKLIILTFTSAFLQFSLFYLEKAPKSGDFIWGVYLATCISFSTALIILLNYKDRMKNIYFYICLGIFVFHVVEGSIYMFGVRACERYGIPLLWFV